MRPIVLALPVSLLACSGISVGTDVGGGSGGTAGSSATSTTSSSTSSSGSASSGGVSCSTDPQTGVTLCEQVNACPGLVVDQGAFPGCGFRLGGASKLDLECLCNGDTLCPIGVPTTCTQASQLLNQGQTELLVCQAVDTGGCIQLVGADAGSSSNGCDRACESQCQSDPGCVSLCGC
jgi:hypothetical protein